MIRSIFFTIILVLVLIGATKRNNTAEFIKEKRFPVYNYKYILKAQHNVSQNNLDDDFDQEDEESTNTAAINRQMYRQMLNKEALEENKEGKLSRNQSCNFSKGYKVSKVLPNKIIPNRLLDQNLKAEYYKEQEIKANRSNIDLSNLKDKIDKLEEELKLVKIQVKNPETTCLCNKISNTKTEFENKIDQE
ncbi:hypothetical protein OCHUTO_0564 [Orientia chuto str. Dubai]|uniref:Uncharacterized protein n=1 Tax=Orientia chuto str. Dubai TaxID=1359168 RepID=A0A0F3MKC0_9RICK|nr:hypothetical protein [Candidatus Orientia mediorientalis]KJV56180.1 hypothetical protein OCHUTO_0564 [Orientia chuto str. Dubai]